MENKRKRGLEWHILQKNQQDPHITYLYLILLSHAGGSGQFLILNSTTRGKEREEDRKRVRSGVDVIKLNFN